MISKEALAAEKQAMNRLYVELSGVVDGREMSLLHYVMTQAMKDFRAERAEDRWRRCAFQGRCLQHAEQRCLGCDRWRPKKEGLR